MNERRFCQGDTYEQFLAKLPAQEQSGYRLSYRRARAALERSTLDMPDRPVVVVAVCEGWCLDTRVNVPLVAALAERLTSLSLRCFCFGLEEHQDLKVVKIPTFIFYDESFREIGRWVERPATVARVLREGSEEEKRAILSEYVAGKHHHETLDEIGALLGVRA